MAQLCEGIISIRHGSQKMSARFSSIGLI